MDKINGPVVLLSGGLDSAVTLAIAKKREQGTIHCLSFDYNQRHRKEVNSSELLASYYDCVWQPFYLPLNSLGNLSLCEGSSELPQTTGVKEGEIPSTWVPQRNTVFVTLAHAWAEMLGSLSVYIGANIIDYSGYPDCRPGFFNSLQETLNLGSKKFSETKEIITIKTPIIDMTKEEIVKQGQRLGVPFELTWSCYSGRDRACGVCDSCRIRLKAFKDRGIKDPIDYEALQ